MPPLAELLARLDCPPHAFQGVVRINKKYGIVRHHARVAFKCVGFGIEGHHPAVGMRAAHGNAKQFSCQHVRGCAAAADVSGPAGGKCTVSSLGSPQAEFDDGIAHSGSANPRSLSGDQRLEVHDVK